jgi:hypothetical protein
MDVELLGEYSPPLLGAPPAGNRRTQVTLKLGQYPDEVYEPLALLYDSDLIYILTTQAQDPSVARYAESN